MCGIFLTTRPRDFEPSGLQSITEQLKHRGPDAQNFVFGEMAAAAHTRLAVIGLGLPGAQPVEAGAGQLLVFNGEIYNFRQVAKSMGLTGIESDTQVLTAILATNRLNFLSTLRGMFAFAYWRPETGTVLALRDQYGIKPLYALEHPAGGVSLASEVLPLAGHPDAKSVDPLEVAHFLAEGHPGRGGTLYSNIRNLLPGILYRWKVDATGLFEKSAERLSWGPYLEAESLEEALRDSIAHHLVADVELGVFLSGGVDSTLIAAMAAHVMPGLKMFTLSFPETPEIDESAIARDNARLIGGQHIVVEVRRSQLAAAAEELVRLTGQPMGDAAALPLYVLSQAARESVPVVLAGEGADELFGGYARYSVERFTQAFPFPLLPGSVTAFLLRGRAPTRKIRALESVARGGTFRGHSALLQGEFDATTQILPTAYGRGSLIRSEVDWASLRRGSPPTMPRYRAYDLERWLPGMYLEKTDRATMAHGLEARVPFLDPVVSSWARRHPTRNSKKQPLRDLLTDLVPNRSLPSRKKGLSVDIASLLQGPLSEYVDRELRSHSSLLAAVFGVEAQAHLRERSSVSDVLRFRIAQIGLWDQIVRDSP